MNEARTGDVDGIRWTLAPSAPVILRTESLRAVLLTQPTTQIIKQGSHREVFRLTIDGISVYWKRCKINGPRAWWRDALRGPKASLEFRQTTMLQERGIETIEPIAWGRSLRSRWDGSELITRALEDVVPLDSYLLTTTLSTRERQTLTVAFGEYLARLHNAGIRHPDLHPGNLLYRRESERHRFVLIDVHDLTLGSPLSFQERRDSLVMLNCWFQIRTARTDRRRFFEAYANAAGLDEDRYADLESRSWIANRDLWASRNRRALRTNRSFQRVRSGSVAGHASSELDAAFRDQILKDPDAPFLTRATIKDSPTSTVVPMSSPQGEMIFKRFNIKDWFDPLTNLVRESPALRSWLRGHTLLDRGIPTAMPRLMLHRRRAGLDCEGYLLCDRAAGVSLDLAIPAMAVGQRRDAVDRLGGLIRKMHDRFVTHRDLKAPNILVHEGEFTLIDLVGVRVVKQVPRPIRVRDLSRLNVSFWTSPAVTRTDRLRFLRRYLRWALHGSDGWKRWWRDIDRASRAKVERNRQRNRPLA